MSSVTKIEKENLQTIDWDKVKTVEDVVTILSSLHKTIQFYPSETPKLAKFAKGDKI